MENDKTQEAYVYPKPGEFKGSHRDAIVNFEYAKERQRLLDGFAMQALPWALQWVPSPNDSAKAAQVAYEAADMVLLEREKRMNAESPPAVDVLAELERIEGRMDEPGQHSLSWQEEYSKTRDELNRLINKIKSQ